MKKQNLISTLSVLALMSFAGSAMAGGSFEEQLAALQRGGLSSDIVIPEAVTALEGVSKGYVAANDAAAGAPSRPVEWVAIPAGKFIMGTDSGNSGFLDAKPAHEVAIKEFMMSKTAVTVEQYAECVAKEACTAPGSGGHCNWDSPGRQQHPVNCVSWHQAQAYAKFKGARLPSEAEFEYAATSGGKNQKYPWGNEEPTRELAVFNVPSTMPVCSKPKGNTEQGLCDMSGNVWQWVQDVYQTSYSGAPVDGGALEGAGPSRVIRGGCFFNYEVELLRADNREDDAPEGSFEGAGFRIAKSKSAAKNIDVNGVTKGVSKAYNNGMNRGWVCSVGMWYGEGVSEYAARQAVVNNCIVSTQGAAASACQLAMGSATCRQR